MVPSDPPGVLRVPILGPNRGMFSKLNGPSPLGSGGHSYTSFSIGRFYAQWNSFGGDVAGILECALRSSYIADCRYRRLTEFGPLPWQAKADKELTLSASPATAVGQSLLTMAKFY